MTTSRPPYQHRRRRLFQAGIMAWLLLCLIFALAIALHLQGPLTVDAQTWKQSVSQFLSMAFT